MIVKTLGELGEALGRSRRVFSDWRSKGVTVPVQGPYDVEAIKQQAIDLGLYDRLGSDPKGVTNGGGSKASELVSGISLQQKMANLKLTNAKLEGLLRENRAKMKDLVPAGDVFQALMRFASILRERGVALRQRGNPDAVDAAGMLEDSLKQLEQESAEMFGPKDE